ncbi:MAG: DUF1302 family protein [Thermodesulfobacteriota bacterium]
MKTRNFHPAVVLAILVLCGGLFFSSASPDASAAEQPPAASSAVGTGGSGPDETEEPGSDEDATEGDDLEEDTEEEEDSLLTYNGFIELQSFLNTYRDQDFGDAVKKNEIRNRLEARFGEDDLHLFMASDQYYQAVFWKEDDEKDYRYTAESDIKRNLRITSTDGEIAFNELYLNYGRDSFRLRLGNQMFSWGTADGINPTAYFNPYDLREFVFRDDDEFRFGVPAVSSMLFLDDHTLELVFMPVHVSMQLAPNDNFWSLRQDDILYRMVFEESDGMTVEPKNFGYGFRLSTNILESDVSVSAYHGPDREPALVPTAVQVETNRPVSVVIQQQYSVVNYFGLDFSRTIGDFVVQCEAAYSPNKPNIVEQNVSFTDVRFPYEVEESPYVSYALGFNYFIPLHRLLEEHEGESVFTFEWFQSKFFKKDVSQPYLFSDLLSFKYEDTFYNGRIPVAFTAIFDTRNGGRMYKPEIGWDFQNGITLELAYAGISGQEEPGELIQNSFYYYRDNDMVTFQLRYEY